MFVSLIFSVRSLYFKFHNFRLLRLMDIGLDFSSISVLLSFIYYYYLKIFFYFTSLDTCFLTVLRLVSANFHCMIIIIFFEYLMDILASIFLLPTFLFIPVNSRSSTTSYLHPLDFLQFLFPPFLLHYVQPS